MFKTKETNYLDVAANAFADNAEIQKTTGTTKTLSNVVLGAVIVNDVVKTITKVQRIKKYQKIINYAVIFSAVFYGLFKLRKEYNTNGYEKNSDY